MLQSAPCLHSCLGDCVMQGFEDCNWSWNEIQRYSWLEEGSRTPQQHGDCSLTLVSASSM